VIRAIRSRRAVSTSDNQSVDDLTPLLLGLCRDYLTTYASHHTHTELATFLRTQGIRLDWFIDMLQLTTRADRSR
jgi:hypothetical protein